MSSTKRLALEREGSSEVPEPHKRRAIDNESNGESSGDEEGVGRGGPKWTALEHRGVTFPAGYTPHGVKLLFKVRLLTFQLVGRAH